ncbi:MAG: hypothetical protein FWC32_08255 [Firmicutes bacterium]|nr:hypothetical protein [Bacillota bacterium]
MFEPDNHQKNAMGLTFLLNHLTADSPYGTEAIKQITVFSRGDTSTLIECFDNIDKAISIQSSRDTDVLRHFLMNFKNIRASVVKLETAVLNEVELFELKNFLLTFEKFLHVFEKLNKVIQFHGIYFTNSTAALNILDPQKKRMVPFSLEDGFSEKLVKIRGDKARLELKLRQETNETKYSVMQAERLKIVMAEDAEEEIVMAELCQQLHSFAADFISNMDNLGKLDLVLAKSRLATDFNAIRPKIGSLRLVLENMSNPFVENMLAQDNKQFTKISLTLDAGVTIITGANMGGKSVAIKTAALNIMLCRLGFFVVAEKAEIPLFDGICLILSDEQNTAGGLSTFGAEIKRFDTIAKGLKSNFIFIALDEFARGTNPQEGAAIVRAIAKFLSGKSSISLMSTHFDGVVPLNSAHYQVKGLKPDIQKNDIGLTSDFMDYQLIKTAPNAPVPKDALNICKLMELDSEIIAEIEREY